MAYASWCVCVCVRLPVQQIGVISRGSIPAIFGSPNVRVALLATMYLMCMYACNTMAHTINTRQRRRVRVRVRVFVMHARMHVTLAIE